MELYSRLLCQEALRFAKRIICEPVGAIAILGESHQR
jgi:hypothetical protein